MVANKQLSKILYSSTTTLSVWAILSRIAYAEENTTTSTPNELSSGTAAGTEVNISEPVATTTTTQAAHTTAQTTQTTTPDQIFGLIDTETAIYILFGIALIALIFALIILFSYVSKNTLKRETLHLRQENKKLSTEINQRLNELENKTTSNIKRVEGLNEKINKHHNDLSQLSNSSINQTNKEPERIISPIIKTQEQIALEQHRALKNLWKPFINEYNQLSYNKTNSFQDKTDRKNFVQNNNVKSFSCENYENRLRNPNLPIKLESVEPSNGMYWAYPLKDNLFAVVPNLKTTYEPQLHETAGMKEAFKSNFESGSTFSRVIVKTPAIFDYTNGIWTLKKQGEIELSN